MREEGQKTDPVKLLTVGIKVLLVRHLLHLQLHPRRPHPLQHIVLKILLHPPSLVSSCVTVFLGLSREELNGWVALDPESLRNGFFNCAVNLTEFARLSFKVSCS